MNAVPHHILRPMDVAARKGTRLICSNGGCRAHVATFKQTLMCGAPFLGVDLFEWQPGQNRDAGSGSICNKCGAPFMQDTLVASKPGYRDRKFHTDIGWIGYTFKVPRN